MENIEKQPYLPLSKTLLVLIGLPVISTLISLLLLKKSLFTNAGLDFFSTFWLIITGWYILQIWIIAKVLKTYGWSWKNIGFSHSKKQVIYLISGYLIFAVCLLIFIEMALADAGLDPEKLKSLSDLSNLTPKTTTERIIFIAMGLVAGLSEEFTYRGFAIRALESYRINKWLAVILAAVPFIFQHGLKSVNQFWWFLIWGLVFGVLFLLTKKLYINIILHWLVILSAMVAILQVLNK